MVDLTTATANRPQTETPRQIRRFAGRLGEMMIFPLASHGTQNPMSISRFGSHGLERYKLWNFIGVVLKDLRLNLLKLGAGRLYDQLHLAIHDYLFLPVVDGLDPINNVHAGGQAPLHE
jgi:hypothetical protein